MLSDFMQRNVRIAAASCRNNNECILWLSELQRSNIVGWHGFDSANQIQPTVSVESIQSPD